jgi:hypothetical protein
MQLIIVLRSGILLDLLSLAQGLHKFAPCSKLGKLRSDLVQPLISELVFRNRRSRVSLFSPAQTIGVIDEIHSLSESIRAFASSSIA